MAKANPKRSYRVDIVHGKHECFGYEEHTIVHVELNGRGVEVIVPDYVPVVRVFVASESDGLLFCFGRTDEKHNGRHCGLVMVAKKVGESRYEVGVWHELYPWALEHFGFGEGQP